MERAALRPRLLLLLALALLPLTTPKAAWQPQRIELEGNRRTNDTFLRHLVSDCLEEQEAAEVALEALRQCLIDSRLFAEVTLRREAETLWLSVDERWTLLPIPYATLQDEHYRYGLFLMEQNFLGRGKGLSLGFGGGDGNSSYFLSYFDRAIRYSRWIGSLMAFRADSDLYRYEAEEEVDGMALQSRSWRATLGYRQPSGWSYGWQGSGGRTSYASLPPYTLQPPDSSTLAHGPWLHYDDSNFRFYYQRGQRLKLDVLREEKSDGGKPRASRYNLTYDWQHPFFGDQVLKLGLQHKQVDSDDLRDLYREGMQSGLRGVPPQGLWASRIDTLAIDYLYPIASGRFGTWTVGPFLDYARFDQSPLDLGQGAMRAYGLTSHLYLKRIAMPALGLVVGSNDTFQGGFVSLSLGFGM